MADKMSIKTIFCNDIHSSIKHCITPFSPIFTPFSVPQALCQIASTTFGNWVQQFIALFVIKFFIFQLAYECGV
ncbi:hypothetical protein BpHYR1_035173 [Brachionus plicatilis]|uniref:Uncharacterized protein n=1 Tax=Brachionus plicatilis TaxID=10195 RepID=A0A3M7SFV7_BRAPC|nr:hypothetical protein BpHYR1_035173 [Brachionus plicatilis]